MRGGVIPRLVRTRLGHMHMSVTVIDADWVVVFERRGYSQTCQNKIRPHGHGDLNTIDSD